MRIRWTVSIAAVFASTSLAAQPYGQGRWDQRGELAVSDVAEQDLLTVPGNQTYSQLRFCAYRKPVRLFGLDVRFANGTGQAVPLRRYIQVGECTRPVTFAPGDVRAVQIAYRAEDFGVMRAKVRVFAR